MNNDIANIWRFKLLIAGFMVYINQAQAKMIMEHKAFETLKTSSDFDKIRILDEDRVVLPNGYKCRLVDKLNTDTLVSLGLI